MVNPCAQVRCEITASSDEAAAARADHHANFGWALFTLGSPPVMAGILALFGRMFIGVYSPFLAVLTSPFWLIAPLLAIRNMRQAKSAGILHSRAFEARYGWLCSWCGKTLVDLLRLSLTQSHVHWSHTFVF